MRIGVTGSTGLIGEALVSALSARGDDVVRFVRPNSSGVHGAMIRWNPASGDIDESDLTSVGSLDAVIHLAGAGIADQRWSDARKLEIESSRTKSTALLGEVMSTSRLRCTHLLSGSAIGYYGSRGDEVLDEHSSAGDDYLAQLCVAWEKAALPVEHAGGTVSWLRTGVVLTRQGGALKKQLPLFRAGLGGALGSGRQWLSAISLGDEVRALTFTLDQKLKGPVNLVCPTPLTNAQFTRILATAVHRPALLRVPKFALQIALGRELASEAILASQRIVPTVLSEAGFVFDSPDAASAVAAALGD
jgi:uncharacterized protein (TIGR01777 family)